MRNYVIDPASLQVDRRVRRVKTDRIDTERLLRSLMAHLRGVPKVWSVVRVPSVAEEDARRLHRERDRLICERVQHVNRLQPPPKSGRQPLGAVRKRQKHVRKFLTSPSERRTA